MEIGSKNPKKYFMCFETLALVYIMTMGQIMYLYDNFS